MGNSYQCFIFKCQIESLLGKVISREPPRSLLFCVSFLWKTLFFFKYQTAVWQTSLKKYVSLPTADPNSFQSDPDLCATFANSDPDPYVDSKSQTKTFNKKPINLFETTRKVFYIFKKRSTNISVLLVHTLYMFLF